MKEFFFDVETTGLDSKANAIHQLAGAIVIDGEIKEMFDFKIKPFPKAIIEKSALDVGGVTMEDIEAYPQHSEVYQNITNMLSKYVDKFNKNDKFFLVGYNNAAFDNQFLRSFWDLNNDKYFGSWFWSNSFDVMVMASHKLKHIRHQMPNFKLKTVAEAMGINIDEEKLHNANYDIELTRQIYLMCE